MSITTPTAFYNMDEASGVAEDAVGTKDLTDNNTVGTATGKINGARDFVRANSEYLSSSDSSFAPGDTNYSWSGWVYFNTAPTTEQYLIGKDQETSREYSLRSYDSGGNGKLQWTVFDSGGNPRTVDWSGTVTTSTWYFVALYHDTTNNLIGISVDGGAYVTAAAATAHAAAGATDMTLGERKYGGGEQKPLDGRLDMVGFWAGHVLSDAEVDELYNAGTGVQYPFSGAGVVKTINGLAYASVKTINGLAVASVKTWNGMATQ